MKSFLTAALVVAILGGSAANACPQGKHKKTHSATQHSSQMDNTGMGAAGNAAGDQRSNRAGQDSAKGPELKPMGGTAGSTDTP